MLNQCFDESVKQNALMIQLLPNGGTVLQPNSYASSFSNIDFGLGTTAFNLIRNRMNIAEFDKIVRSIPYGKRKFTPQNAHARQKYCELLNSFNMDFSASCRTMLCDEYEKLQDTGFVELRVSKSGQMWLVVHDGCAALSRLVIENKYEREEEKQSDLMKLHLMGSEKRMHYAKRIFLKLYHVSNLEEYCYGYVDTPMNQIGHHKVLLNAVEAKQGKASILLNHADDSMYLTLNKESDIISPANVGNMHTEWNDEDITCWSKLFSLSEETDENGKVTIPMSKLKLASVYTFHCQLGSMDDPIMVWSRNAG